MNLRAVFFDVGETLIDETRLWSEWADWLGVPRLTFMGVLGALVDRDRPHVEVFQVFRPGFDLDRERAARIAAGKPPRLDLADLYSDVRPTLETLRKHGLILGVAGNQPATAEAFLARLELPVDFVTTSESLGAEKPSPDFFFKLASLAGVEPSEAAYVGDRVDNDVIPAKGAGMVAVFLRRGLWGYLHATRPEVELADARIDSLEELPTILARL
jgi:HAD superfamily hydrolase (TIGR01549 family)